MKLATIENWPGKNYEILGLVKGTVVQSKNLGKDFGSESDRHQAHG